MLLLRSNHALMTLIATLVVASGSGCSRSSDIDVEDKGLATFLAQANLADPAKDVESALARGDRRLLGLQGFSCSAPGISSESAPKAASLELNCIPGTGDVILKGHEGSRAKVASYAMTYNLELMRKIQ